MADFINTIDRLGDDAVIDSIIDRTITEFKDDVIETVGSHAFSGCTALETVDMPNATTIRANAFYGAGPLTDVNFPKVTTIGEAAFKASKLTKVVSHNVVTVSHRYSFQDCSLLEEADFPELVTVGSAMFYGCFKLKRANLPKVTTVESYMFTSCKILREVIFSNATVLNAAAFQGCYSLKILDLPKVTAINGSNVFADGAVSKALILRSETICALNSNDTKLSSNTYIYVPRALVDSYKAATNWSTYADQFCALEDYTVDGTITGELDESKI